LSTISAKVRINQDHLYLRGRSPLKLVFKKQIGKRGSALIIERLIKRFPRHKKEQLIHMATGRGEKYEWIQGI